MFKRLNCFCVVNDSTIFFLNAFAFTVQELVMMKDLVYFFDFAVGCEPSVVYRISASGSLQVIYTEIGRL